MRSVVLVIVHGTLAACTEEPSVKIIAPLPDTTVVAAVELRLEGHALTNAETRVSLDLQRYSDLISNTLPAECDDCAFVISFAGASIANGPHTFGVSFFDDDTELASDTISLVFAR